MICKYRGFYHRLQFALQHNGWFQKGSLDCTMLMFLWRTCCHVVRLDFFFLGTWHIHVVIKKKKKVCFVYPVRVLNVL